MPNQPRRRVVTPRRRAPAYGTKVIGSRGGSRKWTRWTKEFVAVNPVCWLRFPRCTIRATSIDHYHPLKTHPHLAEERSNWRPACRSCNTTRRHVPPHRLAQFRDELYWKARGSQSKALGFFR